LSHAGAESTILQGDGSLPAFTIAEDEPLAPLSVRGFSFITIECVVERQGLIPFTGGVVSFQDNVVQNASTLLAALDCGIGSAGEIARNEFQGPGGGVGILAYEQFTGVIENNEVSYYGTGIEGSNGGSEILRNHVHDCPGAGVRGDAELVAGWNTLEDNGTGILTSGSVSLEGNIIRGNDVGVEWDFPLEEENPSGFSGNDIYDNGTNVSAPLIVGDLDVSGNWWGSVDPDSIAAGLWDCNDDANIHCCLIALPWCTVPTPDCHPAGISVDVSWGTIKTLYR
jgi:hypothetical protein